MRQTPVMLPTLLASFVSEGKRYFKKQGIIARFVWFRCEEMILWFKRKSHFLWETPRSKYLLHFLYCCWLLLTEWYSPEKWLALDSLGFTLFSGYPVAHSFVTMQNHSSLNLERKIPWLMSVLERWRVFAQGIVFSPSIWNASGEAWRGKDEREHYQCWKLRIFFFPPAFQNMLKGETRYL